MKKIVFLLSSMVMLYASSYVSIHQLVEPKGLLKELSSEKALKKGVYGNKIQFTLKENVSILENKKLCGNFFEHRYKLYIPAREDIPVTRIVTGVFPNSTIYMLLHFMPDEKALEIEDINWTNSKFFRYKKKEDLKKFFNGELTFIKRVVDVGFIYFDELGDYPSGWLYIQFIGASNVEVAQYKRSSYNVIFSFEYRKFTKDQVQQMIAHTSWNVDTYDPIDGFEEKKEIKPYCKKYGAEEFIRGIRDGVPGYSLLDGSWKKGSKLSSASAASSSSISNVLSSSSKEDLSSSFSSTSSQQNRDNIGEDEEIERKKEECEASGKEYMDGVCVEKGNSPKSDSENKSSKKEFQKNENSNTILSENISQEIERKKEECEASGKEYRDGVCVAIGTPKSTTKLSQNKSIQEDENFPKDKQENVYEDNIGTANNNRAKEECEASGKEYRDGVCIDVNNNLKKSQNSEGLKKNSLEDMVFQKVNNKKFPVSGYWIHYGEGQFDWLYISEDGKVIAKLEGEIKWKRLKNSSIRVKIDKNSIIFIENKSEDSKVNQEGFKKASSMKKEEQPQKNKQKPFPN